MVRLAMSAMLTIVNEKGWTVVTKPVAKNLFFKHVIYLLNDIPVVLICLLDDENISYACCTIDAIN